MTDCTVSMDCIKCSRVRTCELARGAFSELSVIRQSDD